MSRFLPLLTTLVCYTMTYILEGRMIVCTVCGGVTTCM